MNWANYDDVINQLISIGLNIDGGIEVDTPKPVRCLEADGDTEKRGWYWLNTKDIGGETYITGAAGVYRGNDNGKIVIRVNRDGKAVTISKEEREAIAARQKTNMARLKAMREAEAGRAALMAGAVWRKYAADGTSEYMQKKRIAAHGVRWSPSGNGTFAVPMMDAAGKVWGLQLIREKKIGKKLLKEYWPKGLSKTGHYHIIGPIPKGVMLIGEGYATCATLHQATGLPVAVAFDAGNLQPVAEVIKKAYRGIKILICADDDYLTNGNPGVTAAKNAAHAVGGAIAVPTFTADRAGEKLSDYNDLAELEGEPAVRSQIEAALRLAGFELPAASARGALSGGAGEASGTRAKKDDMESIIQVDEAIERFAMIYGAGGTWFDDKEHMLVPKSDLQDILPEHGMRDMRNRKRVVRLDEVGFDPAGTDARIKCNLWGGWPTEPKAGNCTVLLELLQYLCSGEENPRDVFQWVLKWLAYPIQHPGAKMRTALVFHGPQGAGKNLFFETVMTIYGEYGRIVDQSAIEDKFNDWASRKLFLIADEVVARAELYHVKNKLKGIVTGEWIRINPKNVAAHDERNHVNLVFLSNERQPLVLDKDDRRYTVIWTPEKLPEGFYGDVRAELDGGGQAALHHHLATLELGDFNEHSKPPLTKAKKDLIHESADIFDLFIEDWLSGEVIVKDRSLDFGPVLGTSLYGVFSSWAKERGHNIAFRTERGLIGFLGKLPGWRAGLPISCSKDLTDGSKVTTRKIVIPSDTAMDRAYKLRATASLVGVTEDAKESTVLHKDEADKSQFHWITRCHFHMQRAIGLENYA